MGGQNHIMVIEFIPATCTGKFSRMRVFNSGYHILLFYNLYLCL